MNSSFSGAPEPPEPPPSHRTKPKPPAADSRKRRRRRRNAKSPKSHPKQQQTKRAHLPPQLQPLPLQPTVAASSVVAQQQWQSAYENCLRWHSEHRTAYWRQVAEQRAAEIRRLRRQLQELRSQTVAPTAQPPAVVVETKPKPEPEPETEDDVVDEEYLKFVETSMRHRMQRDAERAANAAAAADDDDD